MRAAAAAALAVGALATGSAFAQPAPAPRLQGTFQLAGRVTAASQVRGEHVGQLVTRTWTFLPGCPSGPCPTVTLVRQRAAGVDRVVLQRRGPARYSGSGSFFAPLRCGGRVNPRGEKVPFKITVRITQSAVVNGVTVANRISARYVNRTRFNFTKCLALLGHDAARYHGHLVSS